MPLSITTTKKSQSTIIVYPVGSIDSDTYMDFEKETQSILDIGIKVFVLDMKDVTYISSMGLGAILGIKKTIEEQESVFILSNPQPQVKKVFDIVKALPDVEIFASQEELDNYLNIIQQKDTQGE